MDSDLIPLDQILCLIPMKDIQEAKKRLRTSFPSEKQGLINNIVTKLFVNTISTVKNFVNFAVVSPSEDILEVSLEHGSSFNYQDLGIDLNDALSTSINYASITNKWRFILILTADLPFLNADSFSSLLKHFFTDTVTIISAPMKNNIAGTSGLLFPISEWGSFDLQFGVNSFNKFLLHFNQRNIPYHIVHDKIGFDLDTVEDLIELQSIATTINKFFINEGELNQLFAR